MYRAPHELDKCDVFLRAGLCAETSVDFIRKNESPVYFEQACVYMLIDIGPILDDRLKEKLLKP